VLAPDGGAETEVEPVLDLVALGESVGVFVALGERDGVPLGEARGDADDDLVAELLSVAVGEVVAAALAVAGALCERVPTGESVGRGLADDDGEAALVGL
jgi:hypothetical protein